MSKKQKYSWRRPAGLTKTTLKLMLILVGTLLTMSSNANPANASPAQDALKRLMEGNQRFASGKTTHPGDFESRRKELLDSQAPFATILACSDSRVPVEILFDQGLGDIFVIRVAGNTPDDFVYGSLEFAAGVLKTPLIMVLGHEKCGAVNAALGKDTPSGSLGVLIKTIREAISGHSCPPKDPLSCAVKENVDWVVKKIAKTDPVLEPLVKSGQVMIVGAVYDLESGKVILHK